MSEIIARLVDLHEQATQERSHYYVAKCVRDALTTIAELEKRIAELEAECRVLDNTASEYEQRWNLAEQALTAECQRREECEAALREIQRLEDEQTIPDRRGKYVDSCTHSCLIECSKVAADHFSLPPSESDNRTKVAE